jgi:hypothetical protein
MSLGVRVIGFLLFVLLAFIAVASIVVVATTVGTRITGR